MQAFVYYLTNDEDIGSTFLLTLFDINKHILAVIIIITTKIMVIILILLPFGNNNNGNKGFGINNSHSNNAPANLDSNNNLIAGHNTKSYGIYDDDGYHNGKNKHNNKSTNKNKTGNKHKYKSNIQNHKYSNNNGNNNNNILGHHCYDDHDLTNKSNNSQHNQNYTIRVTTNGHASATSLNSANTIASASLETTRLYLNNKRKKHYSRFDKLMKISNAIDKNGAFITGIVNVWNLYILDTNEMDISITNLVTFYELNEGKANANKYIFNFIEYENDPKSMVATTDSKKNADIFSDDKISVYQTICIDVSGANLVASDVVNDIQVAGTGEPKTRTMKSVSHGIVKKSMAMLHGIDELRDSDCGDHIIPTAVRKTTTKPSTDGNNDTGKKIKTRMATKIQAVDDFNGAVSSLTIDTSDLSPPPLGPAINSSQRGVELFQASLIDDDLWGVLSALPATDKNENKIKIKHERGPLWGHIYKQIEYTSVSAIDTTFNFYPIKAVSNDLKDVYDVVFNQNKFYYDHDINDISDRYLNGNITGMFFSFRFWDMSQVHQATTLSLDMF